MMRVGAFEELIVAAGMAPSGDNTQPWRFAVDPAAGRIALGIDPTRDASPMNAGQRMWRIALGAALENLMRAAGTLGWTAEIEADPGPDLAAVRLSGRPSETAIEGPLPARSTNRRFYDGRPLAPEILDRLTRETPERGGVRIHWITGPDRLSSWARGIGRADAAMFGLAPLRRAILSQMRFDRPAGERVEEGLSLGSLELSALDRLALRALRKAPDRLVRLLRAPRSFGARSRRLVESASGLCLVVAPDSAERTDLAVGRAMQRAWLALTGLGLAAQPMMSWLVLENALEQGDSTLRDGLRLVGAPAIGEGLRALAPVIGPGRPAFLLRFGFAPAPSGRTGRLPASDLTTIESPPRPTRRAGREAVRDLRGGR